MSSSSSSLNNWLSSGGIINNSNSGYWGRAVGFKGVFGGGGGGGVGGSRGLGGGRDSVNESGPLLSGLQHQCTSSRSRSGRPLGSGGGGRFGRIKSGYSSRAFVTFKSFAAATVARQVPQCARPGRMATGSAPEPRDVYWPNAIVTRRQVGWCCLCCVSIFFISIFLCRCWGTAVLVLVYSRCCFLEVELVMVLELVLELVVELVVGFNIGRSIGICI